MLSAVEMLKQINSIISDLINIGLCDRQSFPSIISGPENIQEVGVKNSKVSFALKNLPYEIIYDELNNSEVYSIKMLDGALIQLMYRFQNGKIIKHRLAFFPSPYLEEFQNNPDIYLEDVLFAEIVEKRIVPFPIRFDFDSSENEFVEIEHPKSHLTLGQYQNCRIPVSAPITPYHFIEFVLRNFYHTAYKKYCDDISAFDSVFNSTITANEIQISHLSVPSVEA
ncbi:MAG: DUF2290 domain-containing protein [Candidatus Marinimicrobia bacterium]|nr:DUF2290 domain-containing protein [Candidatus Neomarinimicrobiota bacterium]